MRAGTMDLWNYGARLCRLLPEGRKNYGKARTMNGADIIFFSRLADHADEADHADLKFLEEFGWRTEGFLWHAALGIPKGDAWLVQEIWRWLG